jgi:hypothetical protein
VPLRFDDVTGNSNAGHQFDPKGRYGVTQAVIRLCDFGLLKELNIPL